jgi:glycosyltransferase involved in cell wall biosynthesis
MSVSAIIANCNREDLIGVTLDNLLQQTIPPHQIIVADDGSTDRSVEVVHSFGAKVQLIQQRNQGLGAARNAGPQRATGKYVRLEDGDDMLSLD